MVLNAWCITDASGNTVANLDRVMNRQVTRGNWDQDWSARTASLSLMDTVDLSEKWTTFGGLRYDRTTIALKTQNATSGVQTGDYDYTQGM